MVKQGKKAVKVKKPKITRKVPRGSMSKPSNPTFGAVSTINTAPVAIGNSMRGVRAQTVQLGTDSVRVIGRDFAYTATGTGTYTGWALVGGIPVTPACFVSSVLRNYVQMYNKFKFNKLRLHYITSSATSATGDVMFQINENRSDPMANQTSNTFLPFALSKPETVIGPQWTNHTVDTAPRNSYKNLDVGMNIDIDYQAQGDIMLYSKTSTTDSPGYVLIDYDITFAEMSVNPRQAVLPNQLMLWQPFQIFEQTGTVYTITTVTETFSLGTRWIGGVTIPLISSNSAFKAGDIFKVCFDLTATSAAAWTATTAVPTASNLFQISEQSATNAITLVDGFTCYMLVESATNVVLYTTIADASTASQSFRSGVTHTGIAYGESAGVPNAGVWLYGMCSYVGTTNTGALQQA